MCCSNIPRWPRGAKQSTVIARKGPVTDIPLSILPDTPSPGSCRDTKVYTVTTCSEYRNRNLWNLRPEFPYKPATLSSHEVKFFGCWTNKPWENYSVDRYWYIEAACVLFRWLLTALIFYIFPAGNY